MKNIITATYEDLTKEEIAEIIIERYSRLKEVNEKIAGQLSENPRSVSFKTTLRETGRAMNELLELAEDLGLILEGEE